MKIYTIGYGGRTPSELVALLQAHGVRTVVDVRMVPERASMGAYIKARAADKGIRALLGREGIEYVHRKELGNPFLGDPEWNRRYSDLMSTEGAQRVHNLGGIPGPICLLCAEKRANECHRKLIGDWLVAHGDEVSHIE